MSMYAVVDCDNCYVSCERVFRPDLEGRMVVVLSNNDGCVVARSNEAKRFGIKAGMPYFKAKELAGGADMVVFSSNYELYGEITARVMAIIADESPEYIRYSIDEAFCIFKGDKEIDFKQWGEHLHCRIKQSTGMPVSVGIGPTKTIAKMASHFAKKYLAYKHCCVIDNDEKRLKALSLYPLEEVWGIGRRNAERFRQVGDVTALDVSHHAKDWIRATFNVVMLRTWSELNGIDCIPDEKAAAKKQIMTSRSFSSMVTDFANLNTNVANYAALCAEKLRHQHSVAAVVGVFIQTNSFRTDLPQYSNYTEHRLLTPSSSTLTIVQTARQCLNDIFREGFHYKKAGVMVQEITAASSVQTNLIDYNAEEYQRQTRINEVIDRINRINGTETVILGSQQYTAPKGQGHATSFTDAIRHDLRSSNPTTRWTDIIKLK